MKPRPGEVSTEGLTKYRSFWGPALTIVLIFLFSLFVLIPKVKNIFSQQKTLSSEKKRLAQTTQKLASLEGLNEYELSAKTERALAVLPPEKDPARLMMTIRYLTDSTGVKLAAIDIEPGEISAVSSQVEGEEESVPFLAFKMEVNGSPEAIREFLAKVQSTAPLIKVREVTISSKETAIQAMLELETFYLPLPQTLGSVEKSLPKISPEEDKVYESLAKLETASPEVAIFTPVETGKENPFSF